MYGFPMKGEGLVSRTNKSAQDKFNQPVHARDGYVVADCINPCHRRVLEFLVSILNPDRPTQITVTLANTIFGALEGDRKVSWGSVVKDVVNRMAAGVGKSKPSGISPFFFHLYHSLDLLRSYEETKYKTVEVMLEYNISPEPKVEKGGEKARESSPRPERGKGPTGVVEKKDPVWHSDRSYDPFTKVIEDLKALKVSVSGEREITRKLCELLGKSKSADLPEGVLALIRGQDRKKSEERIEELSFQVRTLQAKLKKVEEGGERKLSPDEAAALARIRESIGNLGDVVNKAKLFDAGVLKEGAQIGTKIVSVLVDYGAKMKATLLEMPVVMKEEQPEPEKKKEASRITEATPSKMAPSHSSSISILKKDKGVMKTP